MGRFIGRALGGAGKALGKGVKAADDLIDGPVTGSIKHAADTSKQAVNRVSKGIADRTAANAGSSEAPAAEYGDPAKQAGPLDGVTTEYGDPTAETAAVDGPAAEYGDPAKQAGPLDGVTTEYGDPTAETAAVDGPAAEYGDAAVQTQNTSHNTNHINNETLAQPTMFCSQCGTKIPADSRFCSNCGYNFGTAVQAPSAAPAAQPPQPAAAQGAATDQKEKVYYKGEAQIIVRIIKHKSGAVKAAAMLAGGITRDSKKTTKVKGLLVVTNRAIYCAGNSYKFDNMLAIAIKGTIAKKIHVTLNQDVSREGQEGGLTGGGGISIEVQIATSDIDGVFRALERARMQDVEF